MTKQKIASIEKGYRTAEQIRQELFQLGTRLQKPRIKENRELLQEILTRQRELLEALAKRGGSVIKRKTAKRPNPQQKARIIPMKSFRRHG
ncbi:MAG: hypothetical protein AABW99_04725 [archaeon]